MAVVINDRVETLKQQLQAKQAAAATVAAAAANVRAAQSRALSDVYTGAADPLDEALAALGVRGSVAPSRGVGGDDAARLRTQAVQSVSLAHIRMESTVPLAQWSLDAVHEWIAGMADIDGPTIAATFRAEGVDGEVLLLLQVQDLPALGITNLGAQRKLLSRIEMQLQVCPVVKQ